MSLGATAILDVIVSRAMATGLFERVNAHEPLNPPGNGLTCAVWADRVGPADSSGLASSDVQILFKVRIYSSMLQEPQDAIDPGVLNAVDVLVAGYMSGFTLGGSVKTIDIRGMAGTSLDAQAGYVPVQGGTPMRVMTITLPVIVNSVWDEVA